MAQEGTPRWLIVALAVAAPLPLSLQPLTAQAGWTQVSSTGPSARSEHAMVYDSLRGRVVLFGGSDGAGALLGDTWEWDGFQWTLVATTGPAPGSVGKAMAFDSSRGFTVLYSGSGTSGDTWEWDGAVWVFRTSTGPSPRSGAAMCFDSWRGVTLLSGGQGPSILGDFWQWDGTIWSQSLPLQTGNASHGMVFDHLRGRAVIFGGLAPGVGFATTFTGTAEWDGFSWTIAATTEPTPRVGHAMAYGNGATVMFGGNPFFSGSSAYFTGTWRWDGSYWTMNTPVGPPGRTGHAMAYDAQRGVTLMFGGTNGSGGVLGDTWALTDAHAPVTAAFSAFGQGCPGPVGVPQLSPVAGSRPLLGQTLQLRVSNLPVSAFAVPFGAIGLSDQTFSGAALPASFGPIGAPGCTLYVSLDQEQILTNQGGTAAWNIQVPFDVNLVGLDAYMQSAVFAPGVNAAGFVVSNAGHAVVGVQ